MLRLQSDLGCDYKYSQCIASIIRYFANNILHKIIIFTPIIVSSILKSILHNSKAHIVIIGLIAFLLYCPTVTFDYAQDDAIVFTDNQFVQEGLKGIPDLLTKDSFYGFFKVDGKETLVQGGRYRPASIITFAIEKSLWGENSFMSHLINVLLYSLLCILLYLLTSNILSRTKFKENHHLLAFCILLLFTCHPIHTEVVANVKGRDELMVAFFGVASMLWLFLGNQKLLNYLLATLCMLISYFSKEHSLVFIAIIPLTIFFFYSDHPKVKGLYTGAGIIAVSSIIFLLSRNSILSGAIAAESMELMNNPFLKYEGGQVVHFTAGEKWASIIFNLGKYIQLMLFPHPLTADYYPYFFSIKTFGDFRVIGSLILHVGLGVLAIFGLLKQRGWAYGIFFYFGFLFLMSNIIFNIGTNISERFLFLPSFGFIFALCYAGASFLGKRSASPIIIGLIAIMCSLFSFKTITRSQVWKDNFTLLTTDVKVSKNSAKSLHAAGGALSTKAANMVEGTERTEMINLSNSYLNQALKIHPNYGNAYLIMGNNYQYLDQYKQAVSSYNNLLKLQPENQNGLANLQIAYRNGGRFFGEKMGDLQNSIAYLKEAYKLNPQDYETVRLLGVCNGMSGRPDIAIKYFEEAVKLKPKEAFAYYNLGNAYYKYGDSENGKLNHQKAIELDPSIQEKIRK